MKSNNSFFFKLCIYLFWLQGIWDPSSSTRDQTCSPRHWKPGVLTTGSLKHSNSTTRLSTQEKWKGMSHKDWLDCQSAQQHYILENNPGVYQLVNGKQYVVYPYSGILFNTKRNEDFPGGAVFKNLPAKKKKRRRRRTHLQGTRVWSLIREDSTSRGSTTETSCCNHWTPAP